MSSLKMTFSLTSLIFLIALGLVFVPTAVMAHNDASSAAATPRPHDHPLLKALDLKTTPATDSDLGTAVPAHNDHPKATLSLKAIDDKAEGDEVVIGAAPTDGQTDAVDANEFVLIIDYGQDVVGNSSQQTVDRTAGPIAIVGTDYTGLVRNAKDAVIGTGVDALTIGDATAVAGSNSQFEVTVLVGDTAIPTGEGDLETVEVRLVLAAQADVFSLATLPDDAIAAVPGGVNDVASDTYTFTLIKAFPEEETPPDTIAPTVQVEAPAPPQTGDLEFTITFTEQLDTGIAGFSVDDITVMGVDGVTDGSNPPASALEGPATDDDDAQQPDVYTLTVTPMSDASVTVTVNPSAIQDTADDPNPLDAANSTLSATYDVTPPTVTVTAPDAPDTDGNLTFTFVFSEPLAEEGDGRFTSSDIEGDGYTIVASIPMKMASTDATVMTETWTVKVTPESPTTNVRVGINAGAVEDMNSNALASGATATYMPEGEEPPPPTPPVFEDWEHDGATLTWCEGVEIVDIVLPKAADRQNEDLTYEMTNAAGDPVSIIEDHETPPATGLYFVSVESEDRILRGTTQFMGQRNPKDLGNPLKVDKRTYTWRVKDQNGTYAETPITFSIVVKPYKRPNAVTNVMATKVNAAAQLGGDVDRVKLTWTDPNSETAYPTALNPESDCIPAVTEYIVIRQALDTHTADRAPMGLPDSTRITIADGEPLEYTTPRDELSHGTYEFTIKAVSGVTRPDDSTWEGISDASAEAIWDTTGYHWVIVDEPPKASEYLRANQTGDPVHSVTFVWTPPNPPNPDAPINDAENAMALYGVDKTFGGFHLEVTDQRSKDITIYPKAADVGQKSGVSLINGMPLIEPSERTFHIDTLAVGEYTGQVVAWNVAGKGALSAPQAFEIDVYQPEQPAPTTMAPDFGDASIDNIVATANQAISGRFLPKASDADSTALTYSIEDENGMATTTPGGLTFNATTRALTGTPTAAMEETAYTYKVMDAEGNSDTLGFFITVKATAPPPSSVHLTASYANGVTTLSGMLNANSFGTVGADDLQNIQRLFAEGGSISVLSSKTGAVSKDVVISEIMWALDLNQGASDQANQQFIELYNTTNAAINLSMVTIEFSSANAVPAVASGKTLLDQASNVSGAGWLITDAPGSNGRIPTTTNTGSMNLVSMYRNIDYNKVEKTDHDADATKNRTAQLKDFPDGNVLGGWRASNVVDTYGLNLIGSPREKHFVVYQPLTASAVDRAVVIINEIGNHGTDAYDWVELRNVSSGEVNLKKWELSQVTSDKKDTQLVSFPDNDNHKIPAGGILLLVNSDPFRDTSHPLSAGTRINGGGEKTGVTTRYYVDSGLKLENSGDTLLILRNANDKEGKAEAFKDVVGTLSITDDTAGFRTKMWPLAATGAAHGNVIDNDKDNKEDDFRSGRVYRRLDASGGTGEKDWSIHGYTGIGYKRSAANNGQNGGTPGYANDAVKVKEGDLADNKHGSPATVTISEIMYAKGRNLPQWIELYNSSMTRAVNISEWKLRIDNLRSDENIDIRVPSVTTNNLGGGVTIQPNQTVLIVSGKTRRDSRSAQAGVDFPDTRVIDLWGQKDRIEVDRGETNLSYQLLSETAFSLTLLDKDGGVVDTFSNLDTDRETVLWELPMATTDEGRSSIIRRYDRGDERDGMTERAWILASKTNLAEVPFQDTYYGSSTDIGTPGFRGGGPLPVSLSKFRPERMKDTGEIVVRWVTESELNNAGFNILRSEKRDSGFTKVHFEAGKGTTSERQVYEWKDTTATKPNVVYYYQIQDVSLDGKVTTLRTTHLRGNVTVVGKATTTWGEIKALQ